MGGGVSPGGVAGNGASGADGVDIGGAGVAGGATGCTGAAAPGGALAPRGTGGLAGVLGGPISSCPYSTCALPQLPSEKVAMSAMTARVFVSMGVSLFVRGACLRKIR